MNLEFLPVDEFSFDEVSSFQCLAQISTNVCQTLIQNLQNRNRKYLAICLPCYNEDFNDLLKTIISIVENYQFFPRYSIQQDRIDKPFQNELNKTEILIVPIFDGTKALSASMRNWIEKTFPHLLIGMDGPSKTGNIDVRITYSKLFLLNKQIMNYSDFANRLHRLDNNQLSDDQLSGKEVEFYVTPIIKRSNHRKHNSHHWFFDSICEGLKNNISFVFLTDCGTTYQQNCISRLMHELYLRSDLIGVTARQRVEYPNFYFHPCENSPCLCLKGNHHSENQQPCWKCYANFFLSPAPLQGFEFEATLVLNSAMFNLVEALPVLPGPCQLLNWHKIRKYKVVNEYFTLLFKEETNIKKIPELPSKLKLMKSHFVINRVGSNYPKNDSLALTSPKLTFSEFLRVNMRLAEDRILSFVTVFSTGHGTKWVPGTTFYYQPEIYWKNLLTQRRRWMNGTFASFLFFFYSERAKSRIRGAMFDKHKPGKSLGLLILLWSLQLYQLFLVLVTPAIFGASTYVSILSCVKNSSLIFGWVTFPLISSNIRVAELWIFCYFIIYIFWSILSFLAPKGEISEMICIILVIYCFICAFPIYFTITHSILYFGIDTISGLVISFILFPIILSSAENWESVLLFVLYLPSFLIFLIFFMVFIPAYSFSRLWDTTWGNRATEKDVLLDDLLEEKMKIGNLLFIILIIFVNIFLSWGLIILFRLGRSAIISFLSIILFPLVIQMACSFVFLFIIYPLRRWHNRSKEINKANFFSFDNSKLNSNILQDEITIVKSNESTSKNFSLFDATVQV